MVRIPFTAYMKIIPDRGSGKRFEAWRSLQQIAHLIHRDLNENLSTANIAEPGGSGENWGLAPGIGTDDASEEAARGSMSKLIEIVAVKPSFGDQPDMVTIVGFNNVADSAANRAKPYPEKTIIHAGETVSGHAAGAPGWRRDNSLNPTANTDSLVKTFKSDLEAAITNVSAETIKMNYSGILYGRGGHNFPV